MGEKLAYTTGADELVEVAQREDRSILTLPARPPALPLFDGPLRGRMVAWCVLLGLCWAGSRIRLPKVPAGLWEQWGWDIRILLLLVSLLMAVTMGLSLVGLVLMLFPQRRQIVIGKDLLRWRHVLGWGWGQTEISRVSVVVISATGRADPGKQERERNATVRLLLQHQSRVLVTFVPLYLAVELAETLVREMKRLGAMAPPVFDISAGFGCKLPQLTSSRCTLAAEKDTRVIAVQNEIAPLNRVWVQLRLSAYLAAGALLMWVVILTLGTPDGLAMFVLALLSALPLVALWLGPIWRRVRQRRVTIAEKEIETSWMTVVGRRSRKYPREKLSAISIHSDRPDAPWRSLRGVMRDGSSRLLLSGHLLELVEIAELIRRETGLPWHDPAKARANRFYAPWHYEDADAPENCRIRAEATADGTTIHMRPEGWCRRTRNWALVATSFLLAGALAIPVATPFATSADARHGILIFAIIFCALGLLASYGICELLLTGWKATITGTELHIERRTVLGTEREMLKRSDIAAVHTRAPAIAVVITVVAETWNGESVNLVGGDGELARYAATLFRKHLGVPAQIGEAAARGPKVE